MGKTIRISGLNIKSHPHASESYVELFNKAFENQIPVNYYGNRYGLIGSLHEEVVEGRQALTGKIYTFIDFDSSEEWFNTIKNEPVGDDGMREVSFPKNFKPSFRSFNYVFFIDKHRLFFEKRNPEGQSLSSGSLKRIFDSVIKMSKTNYIFEEVHVIPMAKQEALNEVLSVSFMTKLYIEITRPNPDSNTSSFNKKMFERLQSQNISKYEQTITSKRGDVLKPDSETQELARLATSDGEVVSKGKNAEGKSVQVSTREKPLDEPETYDPKLNLPTEAFRKGAIRLFSLLLGG